MCSHCDSAETEAAINIARSLGYVIEVTWSEREVLCYEVISAPEGRPRETISLANAAR